MIERIYRIGNSRKRWLEVLSSLSNLLIKPEDDLQLTVGPARKEKTTAQRKLFHALCKEAGDHIGLTKGQVKEIVKEEHFGRDEVKTPDGKVHSVLQSSEEADRPDYSDLIETLLRWAAENGIALDTRRAA